MNLPSELRYTKDHEWIRLEGDGTATIGITEFAQQELGDIVFVELKEVGTSLTADDVFGSVEAVKTVSELYMPVGGTIESINDDLESAPESVNADPYGAGWMIKIRLDDPSEVEGLLSADAYGDMIRA